jgi:hypothetical protein
LRRGLRKHDPGSARRQSNSSPDPATSIDRRKASRSVAGPTRVCADRQKSETAPAMGAAVEHQEQYPGHDRREEWRGCQRGATSQWVVVVSVGAASEAMDSVVKAALRRNGIRVSTSSFHSTSNQYNPGFGFCNPNVILRFAPCSPPRNSTGHFRSGCSESSGAVNRNPTSKSPTTSPDFSEIKAVSCTPTGTPNIERWRVWRERKRIRVHNADQAGHIVWLNEHVFADTGHLHPRLRADHDS